MSTDRSLLEDAIQQTCYFEEELEKILSLLQPSYYCLNLIVRLLIAGPDGAGKRLITKSVAEKLNMQFCEEKVADLFDENVVGTEKKVKACLEKFTSKAPCLIYLSGYELFLLMEDQDLDRIEHSIRESLDELCQSKLAQPIVFVAATNNYDGVFRSSLSHMFQHTLEIKCPTKSQAQEVIHFLISHLDLKVKAEEVVEQSYLREHYLGNLIQACALEEYKLTTGNVDDVNSENEKKPLDSETKWLDVGGLNDIKQEIIDSVQLSLDYPQLRKSGLRRTGILLYGPPGTGKTLLAKAVASECRLNFMNVKGPELLNEYVGQSENNIRTLFKKARDCSPSVIFFDELDSLAPNRGQAGDSGGVMDRIVAQILAEMDGVGKKENVFVIAATNRVDLVDPSLLRPGRFDKVLEVPLPKTKETRLEILKALTRKMQLDSNVDLCHLESISPPDMSGADFQGLCSKAQHRALDRYIERIEAQTWNETESELLVSMEDFLESMTIE